MKAGASIFEAPAIGFLIGIESKTRRRKKSSRTTSNWQSLGGERVGRRKLMLRKGEHKGARERETRRARGESRGSSGKFQNY